jgi:hypothetical protein
LIIALGGLAGAMLIFSMMDAKPIARLATT